MKKLVLMSVMCSVIALGLVVDKSATQVQYVPTAQLCANGPNQFCSIIPAYITCDPLLTKPGTGYNGLYGPLPTSAPEDLQTPFDNMAWQMFVALNWSANAVSQPPDQGLAVSGRRVWQTYPKVSELFGNSKVIASCNSLNMPTFYIGSDGQGNTRANNEEYFQASTNLPLIDINGNWTIFERRVNDIEAKYLLAPNGQTSWTLTTLTGQNNFIKSNPGGAQFPASDTFPNGKNGSIEIKASWRILSTGDDPSRYYTQRVLLAVSGDLVRGGSQICAPVTVGLVGMHILQRNPVDKTNPQLFPQWIWATFEHVDNAPMAQLPCNVRNGCGTNSATNWINKATCGSAAPSTSVRYSYYNPKLSPQFTNIAPVSTNPNPKRFIWNPQQPFAQGATTIATSMPQATRCWLIYPTTASLNTQWQTALAAFNTPLKNYMLIGTQWGGNVEPPAPPNPVPAGAVPGMLSNITLETYIQNYTGSDSTLPGPGSCVGCHAFATLPANNKTSANFSFLPFLADSPTARSKIKTAR